MQPEDSNRQTPFTPSRQYQPQDGSSSDSNDAAANVIRQQIDNIYGDNLPVQQGPQTSPTETKSAEAEDQKTDETQRFSSYSENYSSTSPYDRDMDDSKKQVTASNWNEYHSAWQNYYQQFYERYYIGQVNETKKTIQSNTSSDDKKQDGSMTQQEAVYDLKNQLLGKLRRKSKEVRRSRHFMPLMAGLGVALVFLFLQYNRVIFSNVEAYISPGYINPGNIITDPVGESNIGPETTLIIPKINVEVPILLDAVASDNNSLNAAMAEGVAWFNIVGANALPGEKGNFVVSGHSSNDMFDNSKYKFIFARLEQLKNGDNIYVNYKGKRYIYTIYESRVVAPNDVASLTQPVDKPIITLITCTPLGTDLNRLLIFAEQISPSPVGAHEASTQPNSSDSTKMPGNTPTIIDKLFGA